MAITTLYEGIEYRSRLEARWASFFTRMGWRYTYEPFDGDGYIPDFLIHGDFPMLIEVKPAVVLSDYEAATAKADRGLAGIWSGRVLILGVHPLPMLSTMYDAPPVGLLREQGYGDYDSGGWSLGLWHTGSTPYGICHEYMSYACSPTGHYDGNNDGPWDGGAMTRAIRDAWAAACNATKWKGRPADQPGVVGLDVKDRTALPPKRLT